MSAIRRLASRLLSGVVRQVSSDTQEWGNAMLRELDFIESDWIALLWAWEVRLLFSDIPFRAPSGHGSENTRVTRGKSC
jgi:hypothetical protein